jgi:hypothetical protein
MVPSPQTLSAADRRLAAAWAADCAERALDVFEAAAPDDGRSRAAIARTRAVARRELSATEGIRRRFIGGVAAGDVRDPAAAARAAGQAVAVCEIAWQLAHMSSEVRSALGTLPPIGENSAGPFSRALVTR